jgi:hypothetical protein
MLGQLDTFIAFVVVILAVSLIITLLNQAVVAIASLRGLHLRSGIEVLLEQVAPEASAHVRDISNQLLCHPLITDSTFHRFERFKLWQLATAIRLDEFKDILRRIGSTKEAQDRWPGLQKALARDEMWSDIDHWFHKTMDRVSQRFTLSTRVVTLAWAVAIAFAVHLDSSTLFRDLSSNLEIRTRLLASTDAINTEAERLAIAQDDQAAAGDLRRILSTTAQINNDLTATGLHLMPDYAKHAPNGVLSQDDLLPIVRSTATSSGWDVNAHFFGVLFSAMLLSLGAPFWFNVLRQATSLRPIVANLAHDERHAVHKPAAQPSAQGGGASS